MGFVDFIVLMRHISVYEQIFDMNVWWNRENQVTNILKYGHSKLAKLACRENFMYM